MLFFSFFDESLKDEVLKMLKEALPDKNHQELLAKIIEFFKYFDLLSVFSLDADDQINEIDETILNSLLKAKRRISGPKNDNAEKSITKYFLLELDFKTKIFFKDILKAQLQLALTWDRIDVAKKFILNDNQIWEV